MKNDTSIQSPHILLYSSRERIRNVITIGLLQCNYHIIETSNPYIAAMKATQFLPKLVIVDISQTNTKGFLIVNALKKSNQTENIPILVIMPSEPQGLFDRIVEEYKDKDIENSMHDIIILKYPFNFTTLVETIKNLFSNTTTQNKETDNPDG